MNRHILRVSVLAGVVAIAAADCLADDRQPDYPPAVSLEELKGRIEDCPTHHPRLLTTRAELANLPESLDQSPLRRQLADLVVRRAVLLREVAPIERQLRGRRLLGQSRRCRERVLTLAMAYHLTGDDQHVKRCREEMLAAAQFSDWNPKHFLDVAEMTFALAMGYDWLYDQLDEASRQEIRQAIVQKGVVLPFETRHKGWVRASNNWGQVCHGGLTAGALAVLEHEPELAAKTVHNALQNVTVSMAVYAPRGAYPEGPAYWAYGTSYNVVLIGVLESVLGTDFGLSKAPGFDQTGAYPSLTCGPSGLFFNYADGGAGRSPQPISFWFATRFSRPDWLEGEWDLWQSRIAQLRRATDAKVGGSLSALALLWMDDSTERPKMSLPLHWYGDGKVPISVHRSSWTDPQATFVGLKAGSPSANHGQMDIGSFVLDCDGRRWALDLGAEGYHAIESRGMNLWSRAQDSDRWSIFRQSNYGHNTLVIDGKLQVASGDAKIVQFSDDPASPHSVADLSPVYQGQANSVRRGVAMLPSREVLIQDQLTGLQPKSRVRWGMITPGESEDVGGRVIVLDQTGARLTLTIVTPQDTRWQKIDTAQPRHPWDSPNRGTRMVAFEATAPKSGELTLTVLATPGTCHNSVADDLKLQPLEDWNH